MPGLDVQFVQGRIFPRQIISQRPSYINAILIQSRGIYVRRGCTECRRRGMTPFPICIQLPDYFDGCCGNCKWRDHAVRCQIVEDESSDDEDGDDEDGDEGGKVLGEVNDDENDNDDDNEGEMVILGSRTRPLLIE